MQREDGSNIKDYLSLTTRIGAENNDHVNLREFIARIELLEPISALHDGGSDAELRTFRPVVECEQRYAHLKFQLACPYDISAVKDVLYAWNRAVQAYGNQLALTTTALPTIHAKDLSAARFTDI